MIIRRVKRQVPIERKARRRFWRGLFLVLGIGILVGAAFLLKFVYTANQILDTHLKSKSMWSLPSTIYGEAPMLYEGMPMKDKSLVKYLQRVEYTRVEHLPVRTGEYAVQKDGIVFQKHQFFSKSGQSFPVLVTFDKAGIRKLINTRSGEELAAYEMEPVPISDLFGADWEKRTLVKYDEIPKSLIQAVVAIEDRRFYDHHGVDLIAILRAIWNDLIVRKQMQGGSTITQQLVKNFYLTSEKSLKRKLSEAIMAWMLETKQTKQQILALYLNEIYFGQRGSLSIAGVGEASHLFFRKDAQNLTVPESALLAGMIQAPNMYNPYRHPAEIKKRRDVVLMSMRGMGYISNEEYEKYTAVPIEVYDYDSRINLAPYFGDIVKTQLLSKYDTETLYTQNLHIFTTLDPDMQRYAEEALTAGLDEIDKLRYKKIKKPVQGCLIAIEPQTGYIRAFVGGRSYSKSQFNRISQAARQPGSIFKPVVYATAFEEAYNRTNTQYPAFTPATLVPDEPWTLKFSNQTWEPKNYDGQYHGIVTLREALAQSMNIATARLSQAVGLNPIVDLGKRLGFEGVKPYPSIALGAFEVSPWQAAEAYTVFANGGVRTELMTIKKVTNAKGETLQRSQIEVKRVLHPQTAYLITDMLKSVLQHGTAAAAARYGFTRPAAGKTGTTDEYRDAWFVGYTPSLLCVVWTGYDDNTPIRMTGGQAALPIWARFMIKATQNLPVEDFVSPNGIVARMIDPTTGFLATDECPEQVTEIFIQGTEPTETCSHGTGDWYQVNSGNWWDDSGQSVDPSAVRGRDWNGEKTDPSVGNEELKVPSIPKQEPNWWEEGDSKKKDEDPNPNRNNNGTAHPQ